MKTKPYYYTVAVRHITKAGTTHWKELEMAAASLEELAAEIGIPFDDLIYKNKRRVGYRKSRMAKYWENLPTKVMSEETKEYLRKLSSERKALRNGEGERV